MQSLTRYCLVAAYIFWCARYATRPCKYFQLNAKWFDETAGIFSKKEMDACIPAAWRLRQVYDAPQYQPPQYPVFVKPEWSQNARGVFRADNAAELNAIRRKIYAARAVPRYLIQQAASEAREYEIFTIRHHREHAKYAMLTITEAVNPREAPVNSIYNRDTEYVDRTADFSPAELTRLWELVQRIGGFAIARVSIKADSAAAMLAGKLHIIEVNLFLPMPINLLDAKYSRREIFVRCVGYMKLLARATKHRGRAPSKPVFIKSMLYNRRGILAKIIRRALP